MNVAYIITEDCLNLYLDGKPFMVNSGHCNFDLIIKKLKDKDYDGLESLVDIPSSIANATQGKVVIVEDKIYYNGKEVHNVIVERILAFIKNDLPFEPLVLFLENLLSNPTTTAIDELYLFLEKGQLPLTDDGHFLAYKKVNNDYRSFVPSPETGEYFDHSVGSIVSEDRSVVDTNRNATCSRGLHFCSLNYLPHYYGGNGRVMILKINPRDVVSIPSDYSNSKGRACHYEVIAEYTSSHKEYKEAFDSPLYNSETDFKEADDISVKKIYGVKSNGQKFYNKRGANGRFQKLTDF